MPPCLSIRDWNKNSESTPFDRWFSSDYLTNPVPPFPMNDYNLTCFAGRIRAD